MTRTTLSRSRTTWSLISIFLLSGTLLFFALQRDGRLLQSHEDPVPGDASAGPSHEELRTAFFQPSQPTPFPIPEGLKPQVEFWKKIFTEYSSRQAVIHDRRHVNIIYGVIDLSDRELYSSRARSKSIRSAVHKYKVMLRRLSALDPKKIDSLSGEEQKVFRMVREAPGNYRFDRAQRNFRVQYGLRDKFRRSLTDSTPYLRDMERIFEGHGLPVELTRLPFAESSFNLEAYSLAGAAGIWQFTRTTGKNYLKINQYVDERRDPMKSTEAAAQLLSSCYRQFRSWPLAVTAYNHGSYALQQAVRQTNSKDLGTIINQHRGRTFGFSSRNFYAEFLAILEILQDYQRYFGDIDILPPDEYEVFFVEHYIKMNTLLANTSLDRDSVSRLNPELRDAVLTSRRFLPKHYPLRVPAGMKEELIHAYAMIDPSEKRSHISVTLHHRVKPGQSLSSIAVLYDTSVRAIMSANSIKNPDRLNVGQLLKIPTRA
ncbi:MAG: transglycosylase SLT domain-containing protein [Nitrospiraceae bacterium]|nr:MAG: transglycosylase SLT domain-containing protein [Nitrospiraceae bacterium]